jgi:hypothetical protein
MSIRFVNQYFTFNKLQEIHDDINNPNHSYVRFALSSSRKRTDTGEREYSDWFGVARGKAFDVVKNLVKGDFISCSGSVERVPFKQADGTKKWPDASLVIFQAEKYVRSEEPEPAPTVDNVPQPPPSDFPF